MTLGTSASFAGIGGADTISALGGSTIDGGAGADIITINSSAGYSNVGSTVKGGLGNDLIISIFTSGGSYDGAGGIDTIDFSQDSFDGQAITLGATGFSLFGASFTGFENVTGSKGDDTIIGSSVANVLKGFDGNDTIEAARAPTASMAGTVRIRCPTRNQRRA